MWHLFKLDLRDGVYYPEYQDSFEDYGNAIAARNKLHGKGICTQLSNVREVHPHRVFNL